MKKFIKSRCFPVFTAAMLSLAALPTLAFADVCEKINYSDQTKIYAQVTRHVNGNSSITAKDAACILKNVASTDDQEKIGTYLGTHLKNSDKLDDMLNSVQDRRTRNNIERAVLGNSSQSNAEVINNVCGRINFKHKKDSPYVQVKNIVSDNSVIRADDATCILKRVNDSQQQKIGVYLASRLYDPQNVHLMINVVKKQKTKDEIKEAAQAINQHGHNGHHNNGNNHVVSNAANSTLSVVNNLCDRVNYNTRGNQNGPAVQVKSIVSGDLFVYSNDAACVLKRVQNNDQQRQIALHLVTRLADPNNFNTMLEQINDGNTKAEVMQAGYNFWHLNNNSININTNNQNANLSVNVENLCGRLNYNVRGNHSSLIDQVKSIVDDNDRVTASDVACVLKRVNNDQQRQIALYLAVRLSDPQNHETLVKEINRDDVKREVRQEINKTYGFNDNNKDHWNGQNHPQGWNGQQPQQGWNQPTMPNNVRIVENVASKIDFTFTDKVQDQIVLYVGDNWIYARDAAEIIKKTTFSSKQLKAAQYLISRVYDFENVHLLLQQFSSSSDLKEIANVGYNLVINNPRDSRFSPRVQSNVSSKIDYTFDSTIMPQVKFYVGNGTVYASDAASILKKVSSSSTEKEVGAYLAVRLQDRDNINLLINAVTFQSAKDAIIQAAMGK